METKTLNRIEALFARKNKHLLSVYFTAGFPGLDDTLPLLRRLEGAGADIVEIGIPFSDPIADGPTIQESNKKALDNGISLKGIFGQLEELRPGSSVPVILMGYLNPVLQFGMENFCRRCAEVGVDGLILPDLPMEEYLESYMEMFGHYGLCNIFLITPQTSEDRIRLIDRNSRGFIYMVSAASTTGGREGLNEDQIDYFKRIRAMNLKNPALIGFGISSPATFRQACEYASGAIVGSALIRALQQAADPMQAAADFVKNLKATTP
jgi:tryptophan synthase alpha chain